MIKGEHDISIATTNVRHFLFTHRVNFGDKTVLIVSVTNRCRLKILSACGSWEFDLQMWMSSLHVNEFPRCKSVI